MCDKEIVWFAAVLHRFSLVDVGAYVQVHAASLAREIRRKWSYLRMQAGTLLLHRVSQVLQVHQPNNSSFSHKEGDAANQSDPKFLSPDFTIYLSHQIFCLPLNVDK